MEYFKNDKDRLAFVRELEEGDAEAMNFATRLLREIRGANRRHYNRSCGCRSPGYLLGDGINLQRCDTCAKFLDDDVAAVQFVKDAEIGQRYARRLLRTSLRELRRVE